MWQWILEHWQPLLAALWPLMAFIAAVTPTEFDNKLLRIVRKLLDAFAFNWGAAKNAVPLAPSVKFPPDVEALLRESAGPGQIVIVGKRTDEMGLAPKGTSDVALNGSGPNDPKE